MVKPSVGGSAVIAELYFHIFRGVINGRGCMSILLHIRREGWLSSCGDHGCGEPVRFVRHGVER